MHDQIPRNCALERAWDGSGPRGGWVFAGWAEGTSSARSGVILFGSQHFRTATKRSDQPSDGVQGSKQNETLLRSNRPISSRFVPSTSTYLKRVEHISRSGGRSGKMSHGEKLVGRRGGTRSAQHPLRRRDCVNAPNEANSCGDTCMAQLQEIIEVTTSSGGVSGVDSCQTNPIFLETKPIAAGGSEARGAGGLSEPAARHPTGTRNALVPVILVA